MIEYDVITRIAGLTVLAAPLLLLCLLGCASLVNGRLSERAVGRACNLTSIIGLVASVSVLAAMLASGSRHVALELGNWVVIPHYHFSFKLIYDRLSVPIVILTFLLCGTISAFSTRYLHQERGYNRFFVLFAIFVLGMVLTALAGTIETLFAGWELVGLSSALLVAFFHERPAPPRNGMRVWVVYRISDAALLLAAVVMHHLTGEGDFDQLFGLGFWPEGVSLLTQSQALVVGLLLLVAAMGKSALAPFSGWLPRAMEGPTPSSAIFYGALSVHLGVFLLLRASPLIDACPALAWFIIVLGLSTAILAYIASTVQTDIKSALAFASLVQVGLIVCEIGLGYHYLPLVHLLGHACLRTMQFIRAPSLLHDYRLLENAIGDHLTSASGFWEKFAFPRTRAWLYRFGLERGYLDTLLSIGCVGPFIKLFRWCDSLERRWTDFLSGTEAAAPEPPISAGPVLIRSKVTMYQGRLEELP